MNTFDFESLLRYLLRRLVRIAIGAGVTYQSFTKLLREVYHEVGSSYEPVKGKPNSDSRVSLLTGLPRREVRALRERGSEPHVPQPSIERLVIDAWTSRLDLIDAEGNMLPLPRTVRQGGDVSFEALVEQFNTDIRARALLDEWLRKGFVVIDEQDRVVLAQQQRRTGGAVEGAGGAGLLVTELCADLLDGFERVYQQGRPMPGFAYQVIYGHGLTEESAQLICATMQREGTLMSNRINRLIVERETLDARRGDARMRVSAGFVAYRTNGVDEPGLLAPGLRRAPPAASPP